MGRKERREAKRLAAEANAKKPRRKLTPQQEVAAIQKTLGYCTLKADTVHWLKTPSSRLNAVFGSAELGIPYGKIIAVEGLESGGKSLISTLLAGFAQKDGADVGWFDAENSFDPMWMRKQGVDPDQVAVFKTEIGTFGKEATPRLQTAQETCTVVEGWMARRHAKNPTGKLLVVVDSVTALLVEEEADAALTNQNMRTGVALASFMSKLMRRWVALALNYNAIIIFINQIRVKPGVVYGDPEYSPGGKALRFYASIRVKVQRISGGRMLQAGKIVGIRSVLINKKNKAGGGSEEGASCGFKAFFAKKDWYFTSVKKLKKEAKGEAE